MMYLWASLYSYQNVKGEVDIFNDNIEFFAKLHIGKKHINLPICIDEMS